jgi:hypothetical protein
VVKKDKNKLQNENHKEMKKIMLLALIQNKHLDRVWNSSTLSKIIGSEKTNIYIYKWGTDVYTTSVRVCVILCM